ncbi:MAG: N-acetylmuramoyl-L-alanine amidase [Alphaproteobacteria bacterium]|nr:N-acetylmuramoyl-L-alanine amidase [Alphaproteobacteria bacterium]
MRVGQHAELTRFVLDLSRASDFRVFTLSGPYRVVIDLPHGAWKVRASAGLRPGGLISAYRHGQFSKGQMRLVLDLAGAAVVRKAFLLPPGGSSGHRLVVDLQPVSADTYRAEAARQNRISWSKLQGGATAKMPDTTRARVPMRLKPRLRGSKRVVVIDAGHGGVDPGTIGVGGTREKDITLKMARELRRQLEKTGRYSVVMTREGDYVLPLRGRIAVARRAGGELFLSLHADSIRNRRTRGASVYTLSETASDKEAAALAAKENKADIIAGVDLNTQDQDVANILIDLAQRETMNLSARFASLLIEELGRDVRLLRRTHRFAGFAVLKAPDVASVLVEMGYLSNRSDERLLRLASHRAKLARAMVRAVNRYFALTDRLSRG